MPRSLDRAEALVGQLAADNRALGRLIEESDRVVAAVVRERRPLGRMVDSAGSALDTLAGRRRELGETIRRAPAALQATRRNLTALEGAAVPLAPAARGLRITAPTLTAMLRQLPSFAASAGPALRTARRVAPALTRLGARGTPVVRRLQPLGTALVDFAAASDGFTGTLDEGIVDALNLMEAWARSTQARDAAGHVFRGGPEFQNSRVAAVPTTRRARGGRDRDRSPAPAPTPESPRPEPEPSPSPNRAPDVPALPTPEIEPFLDFLLGP